jgi:hypothetical protein
MNHSQKLRSPQSGKEDGAITTTLRWFEKIEASNPRQLCEVILVKYLSLINSPCIGLNI